MSSWYGQIESAENADAVVAIVRDYIALWSPEELAVLPPAVRPGRVRDSADVTTLHAQLVEEYRATRASGAELASLQRMTAFLVRASLRIAELGAQADLQKDERPLEGAESAPGFSRRAGP